VTSEIFEEDKRALLNDIRVSRNNLNVYQMAVKKFGKDWIETVELEKDYFKSLLGELVKLKKGYKNGHIQEKTGS